MKSWIKKKLLAYYTTRISQTDCVVRTSIGFEQAKHIGILYSADSPQKHDTIALLVQQLKKSGKQIAGLCYTTIPTQQTANFFPTITAQHLQLWGTINHPQAIMFLNTPFDYLLQVDLIGDPVLDYLIAQAQAKCRVGCYHKTRIHLFEIMIMLNFSHVGRDSAYRKNIESLTQQMIHYIQLLKA